jgi:hypothetical protein
VLQNCAWGAEAGRRRRCRRRFGAHRSPPRPLQPMNSNYFLNIILIISFLAIISYALGYLN